ncbi:hypothetical protein Tco_0427297 [Tanacetum coccineum]
MSQVSTVPFALSTAHAGVSTAGARPPYYLEKDFMKDHLPRELEIARDAELNPFKDVLVFRKIVEFLGAIPINLKGNMWELEDLIEKKIDWKRSPKERDGAWHIKIEIIDPDGENFDRTFQSIPTTRKLFEKERPSNIIDLELVGIKRLLSAVEVTAVGYGFYCCNIDAAQVKIVCISLCIKSNFTVVGIKRLLSAVEVTAVGYGFYCW